MSIVGNVEGFLVVPDVDFGAALQSGKSGDKDIADVEIWQLQRRIVKTSIEISKQSTAI